MLLALRSDLAQCDYASRRSPSASRGTKFLVAGVALASAGVLAVNPVMATPAVPEMREAAVAISAFENPFDLWGQTLTNTFTTVNTLSTNTSSTSTALAQALGNPALHTEIGQFVAATLADPLPLLDALANFQSNYGDRIDAAGADMLAEMEEGFARLPTVLAASLGYLAQGEFVQAFSELNTWFLVDFLSDSRQTLLDVFKIPGEFAASIGADPLARVLDAVITRGMVGDLGRALMAPTVTAIVQTTEILDRTRAALVNADLATAVSEMINAPAKIANAFLNGYVPEFTTDPNFPPQAFPGMFSPRGTLHFFTLQVPGAIATALNPPPVTPKAVLTSAENATQVLASPTDITPSNDTVALKFDTAASGHGTAPARKEGAAAAVIVASETQDGADGAPAKTGVVTDNAAGGTATSTGTTTTVGDGDDDGAGGRNGGDTSSESASSVTTSSDARSGNRKSETSESTSGDRKSSNRRSGNRKSESSESTSDDRKSSNRKSGDSTSGAGESSAGE